MINLAASITIFLAIALSGILIWVFAKRYEQTELFWIVWLLVVSIILTIIFF